LTNDWVSDVEHLHKKYDNPTSGWRTLRELVKQQMPSDILLQYYKFRLDMLQEELDELARATTGEDAVDAVIDLCVFAIGTLEAFGVDVKEAWERVHKANMQKSPGVKPGRPNPFGLPDLVKPEGWTAPSHTGNIGLFSEIFKGVKK
jgi:predicted HAD superfamily Cof-like phosphohydrolase